MNQDLLVSAFNGRAKAIMDASIERLKREHALIGQEFPHPNEREQYLIGLALIVGSSATLQILNERNEN